MSQTADGEENTRALRYTRACLSPAAPRCNMRRMARIPIRVVCHAILRIDLVPAHVQRLQREVEHLCDGKGASLIEFIVDLGAAKDRA